MKKRALIKQPAGIGDIFFCQKIAKKIQDQGYEIIWPVIPEFLWIKDRVISSAQFIDINNDFKNKVEFMSCDNIWCEINDESTILNLQVADKFFPGCMMDAKYSAVELSFNNWSSYLHIKRDSRREQELIDYLQIRDPFILVNRTYGSPPHTAVCKNMQNISNKYPIVELSFIEGFNLVDWLGIIELSKEFHTVDTSIMYLIEAADLKDNNNKLHCYSRFTPPNFCNVSHLYKKQLHYAI